MPPSSDKRTTVLVVAREFQGPGAEFSHHTRIPLLADICAFSSIRSVACLSHQTYSSTAVPEQTSSDKDIVMNSLLGKNWKESCPGLHANFQPTLQLN